MEIAGRLRSGRAFVAILYAVVGIGLGGIATGCHSGFSSLLTFHNDNARDGFEFAGDHSDAGERQFDALR